MHIQLLALVLLLFSVTGCAASGGVYSPRGYERNYYPPAGYLPPRYPAYGVAPGHPVPVYQAPRQPLYRPAPPPPPPRYVPPGYYRPRPGQGWQGPGHGYAPPPRREPRRVDSRDYGGQRGWDSRRW